MEEYRIQLNVIKTETIYSEAPTCSTRYNSQKQKQDNWMYKWN